MTALHGLNVAAVFLVVVVHELRLTVHDKALCRPFVPPGQGNYLGMHAEGLLPLRIEEITVVSAVCGGHGHIGLLGCNGNRDLLNHAVLLVGGLLVADVEESPALLAGQTPHVSHGEQLGVGEGVHGLGVDHEGLALPVNEAVGVGIIFGVVAVVDGLDHGAVGRTAPVDDIGRAVTVCAKLQNGLAQGVQRVKHPDLAHGGVGDVAVARVGVVQNDEVHVGLAKQDQIALGGLDIGGAVVALRRLCPVMEGVLGAPVLFTLQHLGDVVEIGHGLGACAKDAVKPDRVANADKVGLVGHVQTGRDTLVGDRGNDGFHSLVLLLAGVDVEVIDHACAHMRKEYEIVACVVAHVVIGFGNELARCIVNLELFAVHGGLEQQLTLAAVKGTVDIGVVIFGADDVHVLHLAKALGDLDRGKAAGPAATRAADDRDDVVLREREPQTVAGGIGDLAGIIGNVAADKGRDPGVRAGGGCVVRKALDVQRELYLVVVLDGGGRQRRPGRPAVAVFLSVVNKVELSVHDGRMVGITESDLIVCGLVAVIKVDRKQGSNAHLACGNRLAQLGGIKAVNVDLPFLLEVGHAGVVIYRAVCLVGLGFGLRFGFRIGCGGVVGRVLLCGVRSGSVRGSRCGACR